MAIELAPYFDDPDGDTLTYSVDQLPAGLSLNSATGSITGTPTTAGTTPVVATATDPGSLSVNSNSFNIVIGAAANQAPVLVSPIPTQTGTVGVPI